MSRFSIKDIETITGIKAHTLRIWEQRYSFLKPKRTETNIRYYDDNDLRFILNVSVLHRYGLKISEISKMTYEKIQEMVLVVSEKDSPYSSQINAMISSMISLDETAFTLVFSNNILKQGLEETIVNVVFPFLNEVGMMWLTGSINPAHEHFISSLVKQKLYVAIDAQAGKRHNNGKKFLLFLPEGESHEIGLLVANYMLKVRGHEVIYLGQSLPFSSVKNLSQLIDPDYIISVITSSLEEDEMQSFMTHISSNWPNSHILMAGNQLTDLKANFEQPENVGIVYDIRELRDFIEQLQSYEVRGVSSAL